MNKISIYINPELLSEVKSIIATEDRLDELIVISSIRDTNIYGYSIIIEKDTIKTFPLWDSTKPPILLPQTIDFRKDLLLGVIFYLLGNYEKAYHYFDKSRELKLYAEISLNLLYGEDIEKVSIKELVQESKHNQTTLHNLAIANQYDNHKIGFHEISALYKEALDFPLNNDTGERLSYTAKQYASFLADADLYVEAIEALERYINDESLSPLAKTNILASVSHLQIKTLSQPYDQETIKQIKLNLSHCIKELKDQELFIEEAFALMDASYIATVDQNYSEGLSYIQRAINLFEEAEIYELAANARLQKSDLLFTWAQEGNPQFYKAAMDACLQALEVFKREQTPDIFAEIHHKLGVIYSEILDEEKKRSIWTSVSVSSFKEALNFFSKEDYPYEYGLICHNQGNAYTKYPQTIHSDNFAKALDWYNQSLEVRKADTYPNERGITLLNYIEAAWNLNIESDFDESLFNDMMQKAEEVKKLHVNSEFVAEADRHIEHLKKLAAGIREDSKL